MLSLNSPTINHQLLLAALAVPLRVRHHLHFLLPPLKRVAPLLSLVPNSLPRLLLEMVTSNKRQSGRCLSHPHETSGQYDLRLHHRGEELRNLIVVEAGHHSTSDEEAPVPSRSSAQSNSCQVAILTLKKATPSPHPHLLCQLHREKMESLDSIDKTTTYTNPGTNIVATKRSERGWVIGKESRTEIDQSTAIDANEIDKFKPFTREIKLTTVHRAAIETETLNAIETTTENQIRLAIDNTGCRGLSITFSVPFLFCFHEN